MLDTKRVMEAYGQLRVEAGQADSNNETGLYTALEALADILVLCVEGAAMSGADLAEKVAAEIVAYAFPPPLEES